MYFLPLFFHIIVAEATDILVNISTDNDVCETDACHNMAQAIIHGINYSSNPCDDFYNYGCGSWSTNNPIPPYESEWSLIKLWTRRSHLRAKEVLEEQSEYDELPPIRKIKQYYRSCINEDAIEKQGLGPIMEMIDANGGWPILMDKMDTDLNNFTWQEIDNTYKQMFGGGSFFQIKYIPSYEDSTRNMLSIVIDEISFSTNLGNPPNSMKQNENVFSSDIDIEEMTRDIEEMTKIIKVFVKHKGVEKDKETMNKEIRKMYTFKKNLNKIVSLSSQEMLKGLETDHTIMTISQLQEYYDLAETQNATAKINWLQMMQFIFKNVNVSINANEPVIIYTKELLHKLAHLFDVTSPHVIVNFIQWSIVKKFTKYLNKEIKDITFESTTAKKNITVQNPRWETCIKNLKKEEALNYLYTKKYNFTRNIETATEIIEEIKTEVNERITHSKWMDNNTKEFLIAKMNNMGLQIGYPEWYNNQTEFIARHEGLLMSDIYFKNVVFYLIYNTQIYYKKFRKPIDPKEWIFAPLTENTFYGPLLNLMIIPVAQIQDPYFTPGMPLAVNYGGVGSFIGHEISHSFDATGILYDQFGNKNTQLIRKTRDAYNERVKCFIDQYNNYTSRMIDEDKRSTQTDAFVTRNENIADNVGLEITFAVFQKRLSTAGPQLKLPGLTNITNEQLFFLTYANGWCTTSRTSNEDSDYYTATHALPIMRTIGPPANMISFSNAFNCPVDSRMNRELKCNLWK